ncbi:MAG: hypothetical protein J6K90_04265 [Tidjanibacter sp.]|nr:hypothetical protein [Tidjanibacter sp.]MBR6830833.1 hypothetical protein [Tidjanibacter sp.]
MFGFGDVFGRKPRQFSYKPRYYDPDKDAINQRRIELGLAPIEEKEGQEQKPGDALRRKKGLAQQRFEASARERKNKSTRLALGVAVLFIILIWMLMDIF